MYFIGLGIHVLEWKVTARNDINSMLKLCEKLLQREQLRGERRLNENHQNQGDWNGWGMQHAWDGWKLDRHVIYNVTVRRVPVTIVAVEKKIEPCIFWVCVCIRSYPKCKAHASYYIVICGLSGSTVFPHYLISGTNFGGEKNGMKICILMSCTSFVWNICHSKNTSSRYHHKCTQVLM